MTGAGTDYPEQLLVGVTSTRVRRLSPPARNLHRAIMQAFAATGRGVVLTRQQALRLAVDIFGRLLNT